MANDLKVIIEFLEADPDNIYHLNQKEIATLRRLINTRPAAPVEGLETIGYVHRGTVGLLMEGAVSKAVIVQKPGGEFKHPMVFAEQAESIIAAKDEALNGLLQALKHHTGDNHGLMAIRKLVERAEKAEADNAALTARVKELTTVLDQQLGTPCEQIAHSEEVKALETKLAAARKALEFYADASKWDDGYFKSEDYGTVLRAYPSSVDKDQGDKARAVLEAKP